VTSCRSGTTKKRKSTIIGTNTCCENKIIHNDCDKKRGVDTDKSHRPQERFHENITKEKNTIRLIISFQHSTSLRQMRSDVESWWRATAGPSSGFASVALLLPLQLLYRRVLLRLQVPRVRSKTRLLLSAQLKQLELQLEWNLGLLSLQLSNIMQPSCRSRMAKPLSLR